MLPPEAERRVGGLNHGIGNNICNVVIRIYIEVTTLNLKTVITKTFKIALNIIIHVENKIFYFLSSIKLNM